MLIKNDCDHSWEFVGKKSSGGKDYDVSKCINCGETKEFLLGNTEDADRTMGYEYGHWGPRQDDAV